MGAFGLPFIKRRFMDINQKELFVNQYSGYIANQLHETYEEARKGCGNDPQIKTIKFVRAPEEPEEETTE